MIIRKHIFYLIMAGLIFMPAIAFAQSNDIINRLNRMQNEIDTLNRALYRGETPPVPSPLIDNTQNTEILVRVQQMETDLRALTGRVEQQSYDIDQMKKQVEAFGYQIEQINIQPREPTPIVMQPEENLRPDEMLQAGNTVDATAEAPPQPGQVGMRTATPELPDGSDPTALYEAAYNKIKTGDYAQAETAFNAFLKQHPDHKLAANAHYWLGESYYARGQYDKATKIFAQSYQKFPKGPKGPDNLLKLGLSLSAEGKTKDACVALTQLEKEYTAAATDIMASAQAEREKLGC